MSEKPKKMVTPIGVAMWCHIQAPKPAFVDEKGVAKGGPKYQTELVFDPKDPAWAAWYNGVMAEMKALPVQIDKKDGSELKKQYPFKRELDENDKPTGKIITSFKTSDKFKPGCFDKYGRPVTDLVGNGSKIKVSYTPNTYEAFGGGINFYLNGIQVIELVEYQKQTPEGLGFTTEPVPEGEEAPAVNQDSDQIPF